MTTQTAGKEQRIPAIGRFVITIGAMRFPSPLYCLHAEQIEAQAALIRHNLAMWAECTWEAAA